MNDVKAKSEMLIRSPRRQVFEALTRKDELCRFWLAKASGDLQPGARVAWEFMVPGAHETVQVLSFVPDERLTFRWSDGHLVSFSFVEPAVGQTRVSVEVTGFSGEDPAAQAVGATEGFAIVLCDLKSLLETGVSGGMVRDKAFLIAEDAE